MKRLFVLLITTAVVLGASAGVNRNLINKQTTKVNIKEMKAMDHHTKMVKKGDANGDGTVNEADIAEIETYIMGKPSAIFVEHAADMNYDGIINVADIVEIVKIIKNK